MNKRTRLTSRKRRMKRKRASIAPPPFLAASIGLALFYSPAQSFSIGNTRINPVTSSPGTWANARNTFLPARVGSTSLPYLNYDLDFDLGDSTILDQKDKKVSDRVLDFSSRRKSSAMEESWEGLTNVMDTSPPGFALSFSLFVPKGVSASFFSTSTKTAKSSPLVLTPDRTTRLLGEAASIDFLRGFLRTHQKWIDERILEHGGIVFRGFGGAKVAKESNKEMAMGKEILRAFSSDETSDRKISRNEFEYYLVSNHHYARGMSISSIGRRIELSSKKGSEPPGFAEIGTQTRITDWRAIHGHLPTNLRRKLDENHLLYKRTRLVKNAFHKTLISHHKSQLHDGVATLVEMPSPWLSLYGSKNKKVLERAYKKFLDETSYFSEEREFICEAFRRHPQTNQRIWFELAHRFHWTSLPAELLSEFKRTKNPMALVRAIRAASSALWTRLRPRNRNILLSSKRNRQESEKTDVAFGDGTPISLWEMHQIRKAIKQNTVRFPWKPGDIFVMDGLSLGVQ